MAYLGEKSTLWWKIWQSETSPVCKTIVWNACNDELAMKSTCPFCGNAKETTTHAFLLCEEARRIWFASPMTIRMDTQNVTNLSQWIEQGAQVWDKEQMGMVITILWGIWIKRKTWLDENKILEDEQVFQKVTSTLNSVYQPAWIPPPKSFAKANFSVFVKDNSEDPPLGTGMGVIYRNSEGATLGSGSKFLLDEFFEEQVIAEAQCFKWAVEESGDIALSDIIFETDCQELHTRFIHVPKEQVSDSDDYVGSIIQECLSMLEGTKSYLELVRPSANKVAHCLAMAAADYIEEKIWEDVVLPKEALLALDSDVEAMKKRKK